MKPKVSIPPQEIQKELADFVILNEALKGKTEAELTPEEREVEEEFGKKSLGTFLEGIDKEDLMVHAFSSRTPFSQIYKEGRLPRMQQWREKGEDLASADPLYQGEGGGAARGRVTKFLGFYKDFEDGKISREKFLSRNNYCFMGFRKSDGNDTNISSIRPSPRSFDGLVIRVQISGR